MLTEKEIVGYSVLGANRTYIGEVVSFEDKKLCMTKVMIFQLVKQGSEVGVAIMPVEFASRDSVLTIDTSIIPGFILTSLDNEVVADYKSKVLSAYSKIAL